MGLKWKTREKIAKHLANRTNFRIGNVSGQWTEKDDIGSFGELPYFLRDQLIAVAREKDVFVVRSYLTPIAWANQQEWFIPDVRYSKTTIHHQDVIRDATSEYSIYL